MRQKRRYLLMYCTKLKSLLNKIVVAVSKKCLALRNIALALGKQIQHSNHKIVCVYATVGIRRVQTSKSQNCCCTLFYPENCYN